MTHLRKMMLEELERRNYAESTKHVYVQTIEDLARYFKRPPDQLEPAHIRSIASDLPIVDDCRSQHGEGVSSTPPAGRVGGEPGVGDPHPGLIALQTEESGDILREADPLEDPDVLAAGENEDSGHEVDFKHEFAHRLFFREACAELVARGHAEVALEIRVAEGELA